MNGITLIALIITIILLLILAGVVLNLTIGENGLFNVAKYSAVKTEEEKAREKLELALADLTAHKYTNIDYNENEYINNYLKKENMAVIGDIVTVDNWNFKIDRTVPKIQESLGQASVNVKKEVKAYLGKNTNNKYEVNALLTIESNTSMENVIFYNLDGTTTKIELDTDKLKASKDVRLEFDQEYKITINMTNGKTETKVIEERSIEPIKTTQDLIMFRDKVNSGLTYEGKTITLMNDIDLSSICGENINGQEKSFDPISSNFKGTFDGNYNKIRNLYIVSDMYQYLGLFEQIGEGVTIENTVLENAYVRSDYISNFAGVGGLIRICK